MKPFPLWLCLLAFLLLPHTVHASVWAYTWIQYDEYPEQIDVYGATHISGSYQEQYYYDFAIYGVLYANGQLVDSDYQGRSCEGATAYVSVEGQYGTTYEFLGTCDLKIYFNDLCYPWWYDLDYYWYVSNPLYSPDAGVWEPFDPICLEDVILAGIGTIYAVVQIPQCPIPTGESTAFKGWLILGNGLEGRKFEMTLTGGQSFAGRQIVETFGEAVDGCYEAYPNEIYDAVGPPDIGPPWTAQSGNKYGLDYAGVSSDWIESYRVHIQSPCSINVVQRMKIGPCSGTTAWRFYESGHDLGNTVFPYPCQQVGAHRARSLGYKYWTQGEADEVEFGSNIGYSCPNDCGSDVDFVILPLMCGNRCIWAESNRRYHIGTTSARGSAPVARAVPQTGYL